MDRVADHDVDPPRRSIDTAVHGWNRTATWCRGHRCIGAGHRRRARRADRSPRPARGRASGRRPRGPRSSRRTDLDGHPARHGRPRRMGRDVVPPRRSPTSPPRSSAMRSGSTRRSCPGHMPGSRIDDSGPVWRCSRSGGRPWPGFATIRGDRPSARGRGGWRSTTMSSSPAWRCRRLGRRLARRHGRHARLGRGSRRVARLHRVDGRRVAGCAVAAADDPGYRDDRLRDRQRMDGPRPIVRRWDRGARHGPRRRAGCPARTRGPPDRHDADGVEVTVEGGATFRASAAIVALPLNVWRHVTLDPPLDGGKARAAAEGQPGHSTKVLAAARHVPDRLAALGWGVPLHAMVALRPIGDDTQLLVGFRRAVAPGPERPGGGHGRGPCLRAGRRGDRPRRS